MAQDFTFEELKIAPQGCERIAQFVTNHGDELIARAIHIGEISAILQHRDTAHDLATSIANRRVIPHNLA